MSRFHLRPVLFALALTLWPACQSIHKAREGLPRVEAEVAYAFATDAFAPFDKAVDRAQLTKAAVAAADPLTNFGLRLYPQPSESYAKGQKRPDFLLKVNLEKLSVDRRLETTAANAAENRAASTKAVVEKLTATVKVAIEKRRPDGPALRVGEAEGIGRASPNSEDHSTTFALTKVGSESNDTAASEAMLGRAVAAAVEAALIRLQEPMDRELAQQPGATAPAR